MLGPFFHKVFFFVNGVKGCSKIKRELEAKYAASKRNKKCFPVEI